MSQVNRQIDQWERIIRPENRPVYTGKIDTLQISGEKKDYSIDSIIQ